MLIIDLSNFIFHRYFGIQRWVKLSGKPSTDGQIREQYARIFEKYLKKFCKDLGVPPSSVYFAKDCHRRDIWRNQHYVDYKKNREGAHQSFDSTVFPFTYAELLPMMEKKYGCHTIACDHAEADDIVGIIKRKLRNSHPCMTIHIISNDRDYVQLVDNFTFLYDPNLKPVLTTLSPEVSLLQKVIGGDVSDNIFPIDTKIGPKTALKLAENPDLLARLLATSQEVRDRYTLNDMLINLKNTPADIVASVEASVNDYMIRI